MLINGPQSKSPKQAEARREARESIFGDARA